MVSPPVSLRSRKLAIWLRIWSLVVSGNALGASSNYLQRNHAQTIHDVRPPRSFVVCRWPKTPCTTAGSSLRTSRNPSYKSTPSSGTSRKLTPGVSVRRPLAPTLRAKRSKLTVGLQCHLCCLTSYDCAHAGPRPALQACTGEVTTGPWAERNGLGAGGSSSQRCSDLCADSIQQVSPTTFAWAVNPNSP